MKKLLILFFSMTLAFCGCTADNGNKEKESQVNETENLTMEELIQLVDSEDFIQNINEQADAYILAYENIVKNEEFYSSDIEVYNVTLDYNNLDYMLSIYCDSGNERKEILAITLGESKYHTLVTLYDKRNENIKKDIDEYLKITSNNIQQKDMSLECVKDIAVEACMGEMELNRLTVTYNFDYSVEGYFNAFMEYNGRTYELFAQCGSEEIKDGVFISNETIVMLYLQDVASKKILLIYAPEQNILGCDSSKIDEFINDTFDIEQYYTVSLPNDYHLGTFMFANPDIFAGCTLLKDDEEDISFYQSVNVHGGVCVCKENSDIFVYNGEQLISTKYYHRDMGACSDYENVIIDNGQAVIVEFTYDDNSASYWFTFIDSDFDNNCYFMYFNTDDFTKQEAIDIVKTIEFTGIDLQ